MYDQYMEAMQQAMSRFRLSEDDEKPQLWLGHKTHKAYLEKTMKVRVKDLPGTDLLIAKMSPKERFSLPRSIQLDSLKGVLRFGSSDNAYFDGEKLHMSYGLISAEDAIEATLSVMLETAF
ncbi:MAG: hypothetical protein K2X77_06985 [Candidatus Obscuribacterales bacterium]|jgi:hypothetical protein|nr:hypothetical protein [Candidatus Obscuribacterales bacterium]